MSAEMGLSIFGGLAGAAGSLGGSAVNYFANKSLAEQEQANYERNQARNFEFSQMAQRNAPSNIANGMRAAGLNPAAAFGGSAPAAASSASAPLQNKSVAATDLNIAGDFLAMSAAHKNIRLLQEQADNISADTDVKRAQRDLIDRQATGQEQSNTLTQRQIGIVTAMDKTIFKQVMADPQMSKLMLRLFKENDLDPNNSDDVATMEDMFSRGSIEGIREYLKLLDEIKDGEIANSVKDKILVDDRIRSAMANVPLNDQTRLFGQVALMEQQAKAQSALAAKLAADASLTEDARQKIRTEVDTLNQQIAESKERARTYASEIWRNYAGAFASAGVGVHEFTSSVVDIVLPAKSAVGKAAKSADKSTPPIFAPSGKDYERYNIQGWPTR